MPCVPHQVMRTHRDTILSVLETFVHDPLMEWHGHEAKPEAETFNPMAQDALTTMQGANQTDRQSLCVLHFQSKQMHNVPGRLTGTLLGVLSRPSMPLSVEGQVQQLVAEASSKDNLAQMYIWWMPWL